MVETLLTLIIFILLKRLVVYIIIRYTLIKNRKLINFLIDMIVTIL
nr:MAG TPA: hypothetical protein [Caudoviricetes sp.]